MGEGNMIFNNKRSELEIVAEILSTALKETKKTRLMYQTNLCNSHFKGYIDFLLKKRLLMMQEGNPRKYYITTGKGEKLLADIMNVLSQIQEKPSTPLDSF